MAGFFLSGKAKADVKDIGRYTQEHWGVEQRNRYLGDLDACFQKIGANPTLGNSAEAIRAGVTFAGGRREPESLRHRADLEKMVQARTVTGVTDRGAAGTPKRRR